VAPKPPSETVKHVLNETNPGWLEHRERCRRFDRSYEVYRGTVRPSRTLKPWQTKLYVKYGMQVIDQALVNMVQGLPKAQCKPRRSEDEMAAKAMEVLLGYYGDMDHLQEKEPLVNAQALVYGVSPGKTCWLYREQDVPGSGGRERIVEADRPSFIPWDVYHVWWDPNAKDVDSASYVVFRDYLTKDQLEYRRYNEDHGTGNYHNLDILYRTGPGEQPPTTAQNSLLSQPVNPYKDRFEILEIWRKNRMTTIGNRQVLLQDDASPYWMPGFPVTISKTRPDMFKIEGISETELVDHLQQALHLVTNLRMDNLKFTVQRGATYRETGIQDPTRLVARPGFLWPVADHGDIEFKDQPSLPPEAYKEEETLLGRLQYVTGISPYITGATGTGVDQDTATGVTLLHESASRLLTFKANQVRTLTWQRVFEQWSDLTKQYLTSPVAVQIQGPGSAKTWMELGRQEVMGDYDVRIQAGEESLNRQQERAEAVALLNALAPFAQQGLINIQPLLEKVADAYDMADKSSLFPNAQPQQQQAYPTNGQQAPIPYQLGNGIAPPPAQSILRGNAR
jgi:hypothetical protein